MQASSGSHKVYVYGTLRPNDGGPTFKIPGELYKLGWFPGIKLEAGKHNEGPFVIAECITVDDKGLQDLDYYEGHDPQNPEKSLFRRVEYLDGFLYVFNRDLNGNAELLPSGDWVKEGGHTR